MDQDERSRGVELFGVLEESELSKPVLARSRAVGPKHRIANEFAALNGIRICNVVPVEVESPI